MGKEEIASNEQFLLFPQCFLLNQTIVSHFVNIFDIISLFAAKLEEPKIAMWGKGLNKFYMGQLLTVRKKVSCNRRYMIVIHVLLLNLSSVFSMLMP